MPRSAEKKNVVLFWPNNDWGQYGRTYEKVAENLARLEEVGRVACIFPPTTARRHAVARPLSVRKVSENLWLLNENRVRNTESEMPSVSSHHVLNTWSSMVLRGYLRFLGFTKKNTVLWMFPPHPYLEELITRIPHCLVVSQLVDNFTKIDPKFWLYEYAIIQYPRITQFSDVVITSSQLNYDEFSHGESVCYLFQNAVDEAFIASPSTLPWKSGPATPRLGYVGWITERTDLDLIEYIARKRKDWSISVAGPQHGNLIEESGLVALPNVSYLGQIPYSEVAAFLQTLDICLIPHRDTPYSKSMSPLKLYQYLASGRPVVSTEIAGLESFKGFIHVTNDYDDFISHVEDALVGDTVESSRVRIERASEETWEKRVRDMYDAACKYTNA